MLLKLHRMRMVGGGPGRNHRPMRNPLLTLADLHFQRHGCGFCWLLLLLLDQLVRRSLTRTGAANRGMYPFGRRRGLATTRRPVFLPQYKCCTLLTHRTRTHAHTGGGRPSLPHSTANSTQVVFGLSVRSTNKITNNFGSDNLRAALRKENNDTQPAGRS